MPNEDWYWDQFDVEQKGGEFDLSDDRTTFLDEQDIDRDRIADIETQFIDELYGTSEGQTIIDGKNQELSREEWTATYYDDNAAIQNDDATAVWGLDLRRTMQDEDGQTITASHPEYYEHLTRGEVDWASYENDPAYIKAFTEMGEQAYNLTDDDYTDQQKVDWVREASTVIGKGEEDEDKSHLDWEKYDKDKIYRDDSGDLFIDGERQQTLKDLWANDEGRLTVNAPGEHTAILKRRKVGRPVIPGIKWTPTGRGWDRPSLTNPVKPKLPGNIPRAWVTKGAIKK